MIISQNRLLKIVPPWQQVYSWPVSEPGDNLDYSLDISAALADNISHVSYVTAAIAPSGLGELTANSLSYQNGVIKIWLSNGNSDRVYTINFKIFCVSGLQFSFFVELPFTSSPSVAPAPSPYYGTPIST